MMEKPKLSIPLSKKLKHLTRIVREASPVAVAFSGGVDSTLLAMVASQVLGDHAVAVIGISSSLARQELVEARQLSEQGGFQLLELETHELANPSYRENDGQRCFHCKSELYSRLQQHPALGGLQICDGTLADDPAADRPGMRAAENLAVLSPLRLAGIEKTEVRILARYFGLSNWNKAARPCLASRISVGTEVNVLRLQAVEAVEEVLANHGFLVYRARLSAMGVRIVVGEAELPALQECELQQRVRQVAHAHGYRQVVFDLNPYGAA